MLTAILVPLGMGYAEAVGLPAIYGLYATIFSLLAYAIFGPSRILMLGSYLNKRQWGAVREDHGQDGNAWNYFTDDQARSRAFRWVKMGWPASPTTIRRSVLPWRFGTTNSEGNHSEDVKEYYFYLDSTLTHSYMEYLDQYPQVAYPYADLIETNARWTSPYRVRGHHHVARRAVHQHAHLLRAAARSANRARLPLAANVHHDPAAVTLALALCARWVDADRAHVAQAHRRDRNDGAGARRSGAGGLQISAHKVAFATIALFVLLACAYVHRLSQLAVPAIPILKAS